MFRSRINGRLLERYAERCCASIGRGYATQSTAKAINTPPPEPAAAALRTAEARESALRAARMRRQAQKQDREEEAAKKREAEREYRTRYNTAARKWVASIIALPIFLVTSYYLFDRLVLGKQPKSLDKHREEKP